MRLLVLAFDCNPILPSLPIVAYNTCRELAKRMEITVVSYRQPEVFEVPGAKETVFVKIDWLKAPVDCFAKLLRGGGDLGWGVKTAFTWPSYVVWELLVWNRFKRRVRAGEFDLIYRVSPMSPVLPSPIAKRSPVPFVIGPVNGGLPYPKAAAGMRRQEREWLHGVRRFYRMLPYQRSTYERATLVLAGFEHTVSSLPPRARGQVVNFPEVGFDPEIFHPDKTPRQAAGGPLNFLFAGRLVPYKAPAEIARAFAAFPELREHRLSIVGEGPQREVIEEIVAGEGISDCVELLGATDQAGVAAAMRAADVFVFPSLRELGAGVVVEAMASGLPCVVVDTGAPGELVDETRGIKVPLVAGDAMVRNLGEAMLRFCLEPGLAQQLGAAAERYAERFRWDRKTDFLEASLRWALDPHPPKPVFS